MGISYQATLKRRVIRKEYFVIKEKAGYAPAFVTNTLTENKYIVKSLMK